MNLFFYVSVMEGAGNQLYEIIESVVPEDQIEIYRTTKSLFHRLRQPKDNLNIAVLLASSKKDLSDILSIGDLLSDINIILILPDEEEDTIAKGHTLRPRFLTYSDNSFQGVRAVLMKMLEQTYRF